MSRVRTDRDGHPRRLQVVRPDHVPGAPALPEVEPLREPRDDGPRPGDVLVETPYGRFHGPDDDLITRQLREFGGHTRNELAMVLSFVAPGDIVLDVGGHIGTFAIPLARKVGEGGRVFTFEPTRATRDYLVRNIRANDVARIVHVESVGASDRKATLHVHRTEGNTGATYLAEWFGEEAVETVVLDDWWAVRTRGLRSRIALLKIDTEGMDCRVLKGARGILARDNPILYFEVNPRTLARAGSSVRELEELLAEHHYHCFTNLGSRNSARDDFTLGRIHRPGDVGSFGDVLAFHRASLRYPGYFAGPAFAWATLRARAVLDLPVRAVRRLLLPGRQSTSIIA